MKQREKNKTTFEHQKIAEESTLARKLKEERKNKKKEGREQEKKIGEQAARTKQDRNTVSPIQ